MKTELAPDYKATALGIEADKVLRSCVHCGFCNATCPTYQLLGDELDGPRGRIYLIKQIMEGAAPTSVTRQHLDRCLTCRACETTCPSGVEYHKLLDIGREITEQKTVRPWHERIVRFLLCAILPYRTRFIPLIRLGQLFRPLLPNALKQRIPKRQHNIATQPAMHPRFVIMLDGCVQPELAPNINIATKNVLDKLGIRTVSVKQAGCCGALPYHLNKSEQALTLARKNINAWWPLIEQGAEAILVNASGCAPMVKDYGRLLQQDESYAKKAKRVSTLCRDLSELIQQTDLSRLAIKPTRIAFHSPCTLQHGQGLNGVVESLLEQLGYELTPVNDAHLCCGSAGTYSILQPKLSNQLRDNKLSALQQHHPQAIATANIGCLLHLKTQATVPVKHWIELLDNPDES